jgi:hypothetical protein
MFKYRSRQPSNRSASKVEAVVLYGVPLVVYLIWILWRSPDRRGQRLGLLAALGLPTALVVALYAWLSTRTS